MSKRVLLFPGQGSQFVGMGKSLHEAYESVRALYAEANEFVDFDLLKLSFEGPEEELQRTDVSQPAIVVASLAVLLALEEELGGEVPGVVAALGMSLGEYTALAYSKALSLRDVLRLVAVRGRYMQECCDATPSGMRTPLGLGIDAVTEALEGSDLPVSVANDNAPRQVVLSGSLEALDGVEARLKEKGARRIIALKVAGAYHSVLMKPAGEKLRGEFEGVDVKEPKVTVLANVDAEAHDAASSVDKLVAQVSGTVRFRESVAKLLDLGVDEALELGPGSVIKGLMKKNARGLTCHTAMTAEEVKLVAESLKA